MNLRLKAAMGDSCGQLLDTHAKNTHNGVDDNKHASMLSEVAFNDEGDVTSPRFPHLYGDVPNSAMHEQHQLPHATAQLQSLLLVIARPVHSTAARKLHAGNRLHTAVLRVSNSNLQL